MFSLRATSHFVVLHHTTERFLYSGKRWPFFGKRWQTGGPLLITFVYIFIFLITKKSKQLTN
ncbi:hypothetical protein FGS35_13260 [Salmonella enterica]|uniref:Uncharacterized protein n=5 Tax=Salmonella enterica TaxID=28901 RepID=A0A5T6SLA5_SALER|nr:hypothetical protein CHD16_00455 [Salmonella enterica]EAA4262657.1 hypothetical protein [Salmonella enterica subsp. enterica serovar Stanley]EAA7882863.1 hypothetical protein [Salmonella enterica subsp. enterica]EAA9640079.1 hypothetical protein [Salmonella enterica subsp. enterica serovar Litchfield]EAB8531637.1 hypothetical protein [Salmonella enterica subsp. enterica serovar Kenya]EBK2762279.1 hypothetical protein [Salmonella enterica subsp. enterica serovar Muenchen]EBW7342339.1 hypoth